MHVGCHIEEAIVKEGGLSRWHGVWGTWHLLVRCTWVLVSAVGMLLGFLEGW